MPVDVVPPDALESEQLRDDGPSPFDLREAPIPEPAADGTYASTRRGWFKVNDPLPEDPVVHLTIAAFLSDMTGTSFRPHNLGEWGTHTDASLDHAVWFHRPQRMDEWLLYDLQAVVNDGGRSVIRGSMYAADGQLRFSIMQELLIRRLPPNLDDSAV